MTLVRAQMGARLAVWLTVRLAQPRCALPRGPIRAQVQPPSLSLRAQVLKTTHLGA